MKRIITLAMALCLVLGSALSASALEVKVSGSWAFDFVWADNMNFQDSDQDATNEDDFSASQRFRLQADFIVSENLHGVLYIQTGNTYWGTGGGSISGNAVDLHVKRSYIQFNVPNSDLLFSIGIQSFQLPDFGIGNPVLNDEDIAGIIAIYPINDMFTLAVFWGRLIDGGEEGGTDSTGIGELNDEFDAFGFMLPITGDGFSITPWFMFAYVGENTALPDELGRTTADAAPLSLVNENAVNFLGAQAPAALAAFQAGRTWDEYFYGYFVGLSTIVDAFDPFVIYFDLAYASVVTGEEVLDRAGWYVCAEFDYKLDMMTIGLLGWWTTGENDSLTDGSERIPSVAAAFDATDISFGASSLIAGSEVNGGGAAGTWGLALLFKDITFMEDLSHTFRVAYVRGTNDAEAANYLLLTTDDYILEFNLDTKYMIYENLAAYLELGYAHADYDDLLVDRDTADAWKIGIELRYTF